MVHLPIRAAGSEIVVLTEDMAERDTSWFFELSLLDDVPLDVFLPGARIGSAIDALKGLSSQVRTRGDLSDADDDVTPVFDTPAAIAVDIHAQVSSSSHTQARLLDQCYHLPAGATELVLCQGRDLSQGYHALTLTSTAGGANPGPPLVVPGPPPPRPARPAWASPGPHSPPPQPWPGLVQRGRGGGLRCAKPGA
ncbi:MAG: hypothetical protein MO852_09255, partial [Candidatus Devosia euplotis]|nr:hypothetical protein [Candidatus Devosia euplotis]